MILFQVLVQEVECAAIGQFGVFGVIVCAAGTRERMIPFCIMMNCDKSMPGKRVHDLTLGLRRHELILAGDVQHQRMRNGRGFIQKGLNVHAIKPHTGISVGAAGGEIGELAAQAVSHGANLDRASARA